MTNTKVYKLDGMHCDSCARLISMEMEDAGFTEAIVDRENGELVVPASYEEKLEEIKKAVKAAGDQYELVV